MQAIDRARAVAKAYFGNPPEERFTIREEFQELELREYSIFFARDTSIVPSRMCWLFVNESSFGPILRLDEVEPESLARALMKEFRCGSPGILRSWVNLLTLVLLDPGCVLVETAEKLVDGADRTAALASFITRPQIVNNLLLFTVWCRTSREVQRVSICWNGAFSYSLDTFPQKVGPKIEIK